MRTALPLCAALLFACAADVARPDDGEQTGGGAESGDPCAKHRSKDGCCSNQCLWLEPRDDFTGACFSPERECSDATSCLGDKKCFGRAFLNSDAECSRNYGLGGESIGTCVEACPDQVQESTEFCL